MLERERPRSQPRSKGLPHWVCICTKRAVQNDHRSFRSVRGSFAHRVPAGTPALQFERPRSSTTWLGSFVLVPLDAIDEIYPLFDPGLGFQAQAVG